MCKRHMYGLFVALLTILFLAACGSGNGGEPAAGENGPAIDTETGLPFNPESDPGGQFIVEGPLVSLNLTPQTHPEFVIRVSPTKTYRVRSQSLAETFYEDGEPVVPNTIRQGMEVRATIEYNPDLQIYSSEDLIFLNPLPQES